MKGISRRVLLERLGWSVAASFGELGCAGQGPGSTPVMTDADTAASAWASGGTSALRGSAPDPFAAGVGAACELTCAQTLGPCYATTLERRDISEGQDGLPVRLALLVVDPSCRPLPGATIDVWHAGPRGMYSGADSQAMCTTNDAKARAARWFRGVQRTDAAGRADFDTCFPGWYRERTVHLHFTVRIGETEYVTSQLYFDDAVADDIFTQHPAYARDAPRDTNNQNDGVISANRVSAYTLSARRLSDGSLLASKALVVRASPSHALCSIGLGPGGPRPSR
jgi:protocatechuate 3,4-dioxygenase beta subunit